MNENDKLLREQFLDITIYYQTNCDFYFSYNDYGYPMYCSCYFDLNHLYLINAEKHFSKKILFSDILETEFDGEERNLTIKINYENENNMYTHFLTFSSLNESKEVLNIIKNGSQYQGDLQVSKHTPIKNVPELHPHNDRTQIKNKNGKTMTYLDDLPLESPDAYDYKYKSLIKLKENRHILKIIIQKSKSKKFKEVLGIMEQFNTFKKNDDSYEIEVKNDKDYLEHQQDIYKIMHIIKNWKYKIVFFNGQVVKSVIPEYKQFRKNTLHKIKKILNYGYHQPIDFTLNEANKAYITYYPVDETSIFFAFRDSFDSEPYMCRCTELAISKLEEMNEDINDYLHPAIRYFSEGNKNNIKFRNHVCFRCNKTMPTRTYDKLGAKFKQHMGWFFKQVDLEENIAFDYYYKQAENILREEYGVHKIGEAWTSETTMFKIIEDLFETYTCIRHYRPKWLEGLELDLYIPELKLGFEYNGIQHYEAVEHWGGEQSLVEQQKRDVLKRQRCNEKEVNLITIRYDEPLSEKLIRSKVPDEYLL